MRPIRYGMVGGGRGAFIGAVHRAAAALDQQAVLTAGALSSDPDRPATRPATWASPTIAPTGRGARCWTASWRGRRTTASTPS